jgi:uncharacterized membrane protein
MSLKEFLQGTWLGHPLHPALVHVPTGLWVSALVFDLLTVLGVESNALVRSSFYALAAGLVVALLAAPAGLADWWDIKREKPAWTLGLWHMILNITITLLAAVNVYFRLGPALQAEKVETGPLLLSVLMVGLLLVSGYLGGRMVYNYGTSVARQSKQEWRERAEAGGARLPAQSAPAQGKKS